MKMIRRDSTFLMSIFFGLVLLLALPAVSMAQGRGRGNGNGRGRGPDWDKKCAKFVNCHDARDGRWDGRGPRARGTRVRDIFRNRRHRRIIRDDDIFFPRTRRIDRDGDGDFDRDDARLGRQLGRQRMMRRHRPY